MLDDVGHSVSAKYTPRSGEGITGVPGVERTPTVEAHSPVCQALAVDGACKGGYTLTATPTYFGGFQGACEFQWLRTAKDAPEGSELVAIEGATEATLDLAGSLRHTLQHNTPSFAQGGELGWELGTMSVQGYVMLPRV